MSMKKYLILGVGIVTGVGVSLAGLSYASYNSSKSSNLITTQKAKDIMLGKVPGSTILEFSYDGDDRTPKYDGTLIKDNYEYEVDVDAKTGDIIKFEKEQIFQSNNTSNTIDLITSQEAKDIMLNKVPGATIIEFSYDGDDTIPKYDGKLIKDNCEYEIDVNAKTGAIIKFEQENRYNNNVNGSNTTSTTKPSTSTGNNTSTTKPSTSTGNNTSTTKPSTSTSNNTSTTKPSTSTSNTTSTSTKPSTSTSSNSYIGEAKAKSIMLSKVPGGTFIKFKLDYDDGRAEYEGELVSGDMEYDITVDARTGAIIDFDSESRYDD